MKSLIFLSRRAVRVLALLLVPASISCAQTWNNAVGDWYSAGNWNPAAVPAAGTSPAINNGGHATASNITSTGPINVFLIDVGTDGGTGELSVNQVNLAVETSLDVGDVSGTVATGAGVTVMSSGTATFTNISTVAFGTSGLGDINAGQTSASNGATAIGTGVIDLNNVINLQVAGDLDIGQSAGSGQATGDGTVFIRDVTGAVSVGADLDVGQTSADTAGNNMGTGQLTIERANSVSIGGDLDVGQTTGLGTSSGNGNVNANDVGTLAVSGSFDVGKVRAAMTADNTAVANVLIRDSDVMVGTALSQGNIEIARVLSSESARGVSTASLTFVEVDVITTNDSTVGELALGGTSAQNSARGTLRLIDSRLDTRDLSVATRLDNTQGTVQGTVELERSLAIVQGTLLLSNDSTLNMRIDGMTRALGDGLETDYAAIDADMAVLDGVLEVEAAASHSNIINRGDVNTYELINSLFGISGSFDSLTYDGTAVATGRTYVGSTNDGDDGLFVEVTQSANQLVMTEYLALPGDANGDGTVDGADFLIWNDSKFTTGNDWTTGDFNGDGATDGSDFLLWNDFKFTSVDNVSTVPEPTIYSFVLLVLLFGRRRV